MARKLIHFSLNREKVVFGKLKQFAAKKKINSSAHCMNDVMIII